MRGTIRQTSGRACQNGTLPAFHQNHRSVVERAFQALAVGKCYFSDARGLARVRAYSVKSCATGVRVRFFTLMIASGLLVAGKVIGKILSRSSPVENCTTTRGTMVKKRPVASKARRT